MLEILGGACAVAGLLALLIILRGLVLLKRRRYAASLLLVSPSLALLLAAAVVGLLSLSIRGYDFLTREEVAARVRIEPLGEQHFRAVFEMPGGRREAYSLRGDEIYVDAHILKWKPAVNFLGLHTAYDLDRVGGRYKGIHDERAGPRTVYRLGEDRTFDLFLMRRRWKFLDVLVDAEYGSGTFVPADAPRTLEVRVSTSGLLIREVAD